MASLLRWITRRSFSALQFSPRSRETSLRRWKDARVVSTLLHGPVEIFDTSLPLPNQVW